MAEGERGEVRVRTPALLITMSTSVAMVAVCWIVEGSLMSRWRGTTIPLVVDDDDDASDGVSDVVTRWSLNAAFADSMLRQAA